MESTSGSAPDPNRVEQVPPASPPEYSEPFAAGYGPPIAPPAGAGPADQPGAAYGPPPPPHGAPGAYAPPPPPAVASADSARNVATLAHLSAFVGVVGIPTLVGPLVVWLAKREEHPYIDDQAKEALNFNLSVLIYGLSIGIVTVFLTVITLGLALLLLIPLFAAFAVAWIVLVIVAAVKSSRGEPYRYPLTIRLVR